MQPTLRGAVIEDCRDALVLIEGVIQALVPAVSERPTRKDKFEVLHGDCFVFNQTRY